MIPSSAKRQRVEAVSNTLSKPFRSPFKAIRTPPEKNDHNSSTQPSPYVSHIPQYKLRPLGRQKHSITTPLPVNGTRNAFASPITNAALNTDPEVSYLFREQRDLENKLREVKEELNIADQARKIEESKKYPGGAADGELLDLIRKWKEASRMAADELFTIVRDRVNRMGGSKVWIEMRQKQETLSGWNDYYPQQNSGNEAAEDGEKGDFYSYDNFNPDTMNGKETNDANRHSEDNEDDEFTMVTMLMMLNVDLSVIGYDRENERWKMS